MRRATLFEQKFWSAINLFHTNNTARLSTFDQQYFPSGFSISMALAVFLQLVSCALHLTIYVLSTLTTILEKKNQFFLTLMLEPEGQKFRNPNLKAYRGSGYMLTKGARTECIACVYVPLFFKSKTRKHVVCRKWRELKKHFLNVNPH